MENSNGLAVHPVTVSCPRPNQLISRIEIGEAFLLADYWYLHRACQAMGLRHIELCQTAEIRTFSERVVTRVLEETGSMP